MLFALDLDMMNILHLALAGLLNLKLVLSKERCFFPELDGALLFILGVDSTALTFNKICHHSCKRAFIPLSNFLPLWFLYILCCWDTVTFVRIIKCVTLSSSQCFRFHYKWYSSHIERLACSALNPHPSLPIVMNWRDHFILIAFSGW